MFTVHVLTVFHHHHIRLWIKPAARVIIIIIIIRVLSLSWRCLLLGVHAHVRLCAGGRVHFLMHDARILMILTRIIRVHWNCWWSGDGKRWIRDRIVLSCHCDSGRCCSGRCLLPLLAHHHLLLLIIIALLLLLLFVLLWWRWWWLVHHFVSHFALHRIRRVHALLSGHDGWYNRYISSCCCCCCWIYLSYLWRLSGWSGRCRVSVYMLLKFF